MEFKHIPLDQIVRNPDQPRQRFSQEGLESLAASIREFGVGQPVIVKPFGDKYMLISGERRWRASGLAQQDTVPAVIRKDFSSKQEAIFRLVENEEREGITVIEKAVYIRGLHAEGFTQEEIGKGLSTQASRSSIAHWIRLANLPTAVQDIIEEEGLEFGHGKALCGLAPEYQLEVARMTVKNSWTVRQLEQFITRSDKRKRKNPGSKEIADAIARMETGASETVGYPVRIQHSTKKNSGKVLIEYSSLDELDGIMQRIGYSEDL